MLEAFFCRKTMYPEVCNWGWRVIAFFGIAFFLYWLLTPRIKAR